MGYSGEIMEYLAIRWISEKLKDARVKIGKHMRMQRILPSSLEEWSEHRYSVMFWLMIH